MHYFCYNPWGDGGYCDLMANTHKVHPGAAACHPARIGQSFTFKGWIFTCEDTGPTTGWSTAEVWCYSPFAWGFPPDTIPCPTFDDWETVTWLLASPTPPPTP
jgi:hypothetical protein